MASKKQQYRYDLIFDGNIRNGFTYEQVLHLLKQEVNLKDDYISTLFSGKTRVCRNADYATVLKWHKKFFAAGIDLKLKVQQAKPQCSEPKIIKSKASKAKARQIRTMARVKELPVSTLKKQRSSNKSTGRPNRQTVSLELLDTQIKAARLQVDKVIYPLKLLAGMALLILTPLIYMAVIAAMVGLIVWSITDIQAYFGSNISQLGKLGTYLLPVLAITPCIIFMFKPVFARYKHDRSVLLEHDQHEILYRLLGSLCKTLNLKPVDKIYVNNSIKTSSSFRFGISGVFGLKRSITVGMPIVAGLNVEQLMSLFVYELSSINKFSDILIYQRLRQLDYCLYQRAWVSDHLDLFFERAASETNSRFMSLVVWMSKVYALNIRMVFRGIYKVHHQICLHILKPVIVDAVIASEKIVGSTKTKQALLELKKLKHAEGEIKIFNGRLIRTKRLLENIPLAIANFKYQYGALLEKKIQETKKMPNGIYPFWFDEINLPEQGNSRGVFYCAKAASELLPHFELLCDSVTAEYYHNKGIGETENGFVTDAAIMAAGGVGNNSLSSLETFFNGLFTQRRVLSIATDKAAKSGVLNHQALIDQIRWKTLDFKSAINARKLFKEKCARAKLGQSFIKARIKIVPKQYSLKSTDSKSIIACIAIHEHRLEQANKTLNEMDLLFRKRMDLCIDRMEPVDKREASLHLRTLQLIVKFSPYLEHLEQSIFILEALLSPSTKGSANKLTDTVRFYKQQVQNNLYKIIFMSRDVRRVEENKSIQSLNEFLKLKLGANIDQVLDIDARQSIQYGKLLLRSIYQWYVAILAEVADRCEAFEKSRSMKPLKLIS